MKSKKLLLLTLAFSLFSMINCLALKRLTATNPYYNRNITIHVLEICEYDEICGVLSFPRHDRGPRGIIGIHPTAIEWHIELETEHGNIVTLPSHFFNSKKRPYTIEIPMKEEFYWGNKKAEITYKLRVRGKNSKIKYLKIDILGITIDGVDLAQKKRFNKSHS